MPQSNNSFLSFRTRVLERGFGRGMWDVPDIRFGKKFGKDVDKDFDKGEQTAPEEGVSGPEIKNASVDVAIRRVMSSNLIVDGSAVKYKELTGIVVVVRLVS